MPFVFILVACAISINFTGGVKMEGDENIYGVTKLRNEIYVLCRSASSGLKVIRGFEALTPFRRQREIKIMECKLPTDIGSSKKENCLYISDYQAKCVWKIGLTRETDDQKKLIKWL